MHFDRPPLPPSPSVDTLLEKLMCNRKQTLAYQSITVPL